MDLAEAVEWLNGNRSTINQIMEVESLNGAGEWDRQATLVRSAEADAAMTQQAYWIVRAHSEGLVGG